MALWLREVTNKIVQNEQTSFVLVMLFWMQWLYLRRPWSSLEDLANEISFLKLILINRMTKLFCFSLHICVMFWIWIKFVRMGNTLFSCASYFLVFNNMLSPWIFLHHSVRHEFPLAPYLYVIIVNDLGYY